MFKISEFAKLSQVPPKTLRFYDQLGLLKPAHIDPQTGYRYYTSEQLLVLHRILAFKDLGFSLDQIKGLLRERISSAEVRGMFRMKQAETQTMIRTELERLRRIEARLEQIERGEADNSPYDVVVKRVEPMKAITLEAVTARSDIPDLLDEVDAYMRRNGASGTFPRIVVWHGCPECESNIQLEIACPINGDMPETGRFRVKRLPEMIAASVTHISRPDLDSPVSLDLGRWIERNGYEIRPDTPSREVYLSPREDGEGQYVTESLMPLIH